MASAPTLILLRLVDNKHPVTSRTILNVLLAVGLSGLIALTIFEPGKDDAPNATLLTELDAKQIHQIIIQSLGRPEIQLQKVDKQWEMLSPFSASANQERLNQLLYLLTAKSQASYPAEQTDTQQLQLDAPSLTLQFNNTRFKFGGTAPLGDSRYVLIDNTVHLITDRYSHLVRNAATDLVSPTLLNTNDPITTLDLPTVSLALRDGQWQIDKPQSQKIENPDHVQQLLAEWRHARAFSVQPLTPTPQALEAITLTTEKSTFHFMLLKTKDEFVLRRNDLGLQYHFSNEAGQRLLMLPSGNDA